MVPPVPSEHGTGQKEQICIRYEFKDAGANCDQISRDQRVSAVLVTGCRQFFREFSSRAATVHKEL